jgi:hypothetical protein
LPERPVMARCTPLRGVEPLLLGMSLDEATAALGPPDNRFEEEREAFWDPAFRCYFSESWAIRIISIVDTRALPVQVGDDVELSRRFAEAERKLVEWTREGYRHPRESLSVFPSYGLAVWSEDGETVGDFSCTTREESDVVWSGWSSTYTRLYR